MKIKPKQEQQKILKLFDAAEYLGVSPRTIRRMVRDDSVEYYKTPRGHYRFEEPALEKYKAESKKNESKRKFASDESEEEKGISISKK
jgi:excisionase family DNA binding protein